MRTPCMAHQIQFFFPGTRDISARRTEVLLYFPAFLSIVQLLPDGKGWGNSAAREITSRPALSWSSESHLRFPGASKDTLRLLAMANRPSIDVLNWLNYTKNVMFHGYVFVYHRMCPVLCWWFTGSIIHIFFSHQRRTIFSRYAILVLEIPYHTVYYKICYMLTFHTTN